MASPTRQRSLGAITIAVALACATAPLAAGAGTYGMLLARRDATPTTSLETSFSHVRPPRSFLLVVTEPTDTSIAFHWSLRCVSASGRESGGATGAATVSSSRWVKRVRADWIKHPAECFGNTSGSAASTPVLVRVFADY